MDIDDIKQRSTEIIDYNRFIIYITMYIVLYTTGLVYGKNELTQLTICLESNVWHLASQEESQTASVWDR